jgi:hypothetical protein
MQRSSRVQTARPTLAQPCWRGDIAHDQDPCRRGRAYLSPRRLRRRAASPACGPRALAAPSSPALPAAASSSSRSPPSAESSSSLSPSAPPSAPLVAVVLCSLIWLGGSACGDPMCAWHLVNHARSWGKGFDRKNCCYCRGAPEAVARPRVGTSAVPACSAEILQS